MECPRVCVIDSSPTILETIPIVLGGAYGVECLTPEEYLRDPSRLDAADLLIVADDALPAESLVSLTHGPPILWLQSRRGPPPITAGQWAQVPRSFSPEDLLARIQALLSQRARAAWQAWSVIEYPVVPKEATLLIRRACTTGLPVLISGEPGTGKTRLAREINSLGGAARFVSLSATSCTWAALRHAASIAVGNLTAYVNDVGEVAAEGRELLRELLDCGGFESDQGWHGVRLICATARSLEGLADSPGLDKELYYRLSVLPIKLPALRERPYDIPALAHYIVTELGRRLSAETVTFTPRALHRLMHYMWFGNLAELEAVLARTLVLTSSRIIDADDLLFGYGPVVARGHSARASAAHDAAPEPAPGEAAELIINELAHEFKNPMVTIKTVAQHLERLLADEAGRQQVARLTGEAVDRMDRALENLLQFTRFRMPAPEEVALSALLAPTVTDLAPALAERHVVLNYQPAETFRAFVDAAQIVYAFDNMLRAIARDLVEGQALSIRSLGTEVAVLFEFSSPHQPVAGKLAQFLGGRAGGAQTMLPLGLVLAKALIERNGGRMDIRSAAEKTTITVWLPSMEEAVPGNGKTTSLDS